VPHGAQAPPAWMASPHTAGAFSALIKAHASE
jgi:hypothetical protein